MSKKKWTDQDLKDAFNAARQFNNENDEDNGFTHKTAEDYIEDMMTFSKHIKKVDKYLKQEGKTTIELARKRSKL